MDGHDQRGGAEQYLSPGEPARVCTGGGARGLERPYGCGVRRAARILAGDFEEVQAAVPRGAGAGGANQTRDELNAGPSAPGNSTRNGACEWGATGALILRADPVGPQNDHL